MTVFEKLLAVQSELKAPKGQYNSFGKYNYRSCEDILEAVKPINKKYKALVVLSDGVYNVEQRYYISAKATFIDAETGEKIEIEASAREEDAKKGMDASQVSGTASSYARKYALNGLYAIDDTKDADTNEETAKRQKTEIPKPVEKVTCPKCGKEIKGVKKNGEIKTPQAILEGCGMCLECYKKSKTIVVNGQEFEEVKE